MNKRKNIFIVSFYALLTVIIVCILSVYDNAKINCNAKRTDKINTFYTDTFALFSIDLADSLDPEYEILTFDEDVPDSVKKEVLINLKTEIERSKNALYNDQSFVFKASNTKTGRTISNNTNLINEKSEEKFTFYAKLNYDENSIFSRQGDILNDIFRTFDISDIVLETYHSTYEAYNTYDYDTLLSKIHLNVPTNLEISYIIPEKVGTYGVISSYITSWYQYNDFTMWAIFLGTAAIMFFILIVPIKDIEDINPFYTVKNWKLEINIIVLSTFIFLSILLVAAVTGNTLNGYILKVLTDYGFIYCDKILFMLNYVTWLLTFVLIAIGIFHIKYIFTKGFIKYFKEKTIISDICKYLKRQMDFAFETDLSAAINKKITKYIIINFLIIIALLTFWSFGYFLAIIYTMLIFIYVKKKVKVVQKDYNSLLYYTKELAKSNFEEEISLDLGIFNSLKTEFNNIKDGFEKAVKEETKSQNMKTELIGNVSHDLKTPLTCIKNYIVLLQDDSLTEEDRHEYLDNLNQYTNRLTTLIEDLFEISKANSGNIQINPVELNIVELIEQAYAENQEFLQVKDLTAVKQIEKDEIFLFLDGDKTYRIFENLFTNIGKYAMPHSRVYMRIAEEEENVIVEITNVSEVQMNFTTDEITERFVRGDKSRHETGSGLGLAIAKSFTEIQGGQFKIDIDCDLFKVKVVFNKKANISI